MLECVVNISEGRDLERVADIAGAAGSALLDVHSDPHHHRSVLTIVGEDPVRAVAERAVAALDLREHVGVHPRLGVVDVVPFVALDGAIDVALAARNRFAAWFGLQHQVPCFLYGPERALPDVRRQAFTALRPDAGPPQPHPTAGACAAGQRGVLVAYNLWLSGDDLTACRAIATAVRGDGIRSLGLKVGQRLQVSMNLVAPERVGPATAYDRVVAQAEIRGLQVEGAELVGLLPRNMLQRVPRHRWNELDLDEARTIDARLERQGWR